MGKRGPAPTPTAILKQRGSWLAKTRKDEPIMPCDEIKPPSWLPKKCVKYWKDIEEILKPAGVIMNSDNLALALLVESIVRYLKYRDLYEEKFKSNPIYVVDGLIKKNPMAKVVAEEYATLKGMLMEFGMTPSSRSGINAEPPTIINNTQVVVNQEADKNRFFND